MAGKTLIGGTAYKIIGGKATINGVAHKVTGGKTMIGGAVYNINFKKKSLSDLFISMKAVGTVSGVNNGSGAGIVAIEPTIGKYAILIASTDILIYKIQSASSLVKLFDSSSSKFSLKIDTDSGTIMVYQNVFGQEIPMPFYGATLACVEFNGCSDSEVQQILKNTSVVIKSGRNSSSSGTVTLSKNKLTTSDIIIGAYDKYITVATIKMGTTTLQIYNKNIVSGAYECLYSTESGVNFRLKTATGTSTTNLSVYGGSIIALREGD